MSETCIIIGASHAGVNCAFALRREGWEGKILLIDRDPHLPYHRPPLSKAFLQEAETEDSYLLKAASAYQKADIELLLGKAVVSIASDTHTLSLDDGESLQYNKLVLATGARAFIPPIPGLHDAQNVAVIRTLSDAQAIQQILARSSQKRVTIIGGGYIGLEAAASLKTCGASVTVLERENRVLARVTASETSDFFTRLHQKHGVSILLQKNVEKIETGPEGDIVCCEDGSQFETDLIIVGVGVQVSSELAEAIGLDVEHGICVASDCQTSAPHIYAIGDCTRHYNPFYDCHIRLESVQNAADQAKVAAAAICGKQAAYEAIPWFWSDQYDVKLQIAGLSQGYDEAIVREEADGSGKFSVWYFKGEKLLAVDALNHPKAYVIGMKLLKIQGQVYKPALRDLATALAYPTLLHAPIPS